MDRTTGRTGRRVGGGEGGTKPTSQTGAHRAVRGGAPSGTTPPPSDTSKIRRGGGGGGEGTSSLGGMGLGAKFAVFIAVTVAVASSFLVIGGYMTTSTQMDGEIDEAGIRLTKVICAMALPQIKKFNEFNGADPITAVDTDVRALLVLVTDAANQQTAKSLDTKLRGKLQTIRDLLDTNSFQLLGPGYADKLGLEAPEIINVTIVLPDGKSAIAQIRPEAISLNNPTPRGKNDDVEITEGIYSGAGGSKRVRSYKKDVLDETGRTVGTAILYLSAAKIDNAKSAILTAMMLPLFLAIAIGAGIGFYVSTLVTKPLKALLTDINIVSGGDLAHETKAQSTDEIGYLARTFNLMTKSLSSAHEAELENKAMEHELNIATEIQSNLLPHKIPKIPGLEIGAYYRPSKEVGGDYYDFIQIDQNHLGIIVADVSGKGIPGSMVMTMARSLIRMEAERNLSTADTLVKTNRILARDIRRGMFVTALYALLDISKRTLLVSSAGHNPMVIYRKSTGKYELVNPNGIALGFDKGPIFERTIKETSIQLGFGDRIVLYTDGVVEAMSPTSVEFGDDRFYKMVQLLSEKDSNVFINTIMKSLDEHKGEAPQHDDITLVTVRVLPQATA